MIQRRSSQLLRSILEQMGDPEMDQKTRDGGGYVVVENLDLLPIAIQSELLDELLTRNQEPSKSLLVKIEKQRETLDLYPLFKHERGLEKFADYKKWRQENDQHEKQRDKEAAARRENKEGIKAPNNPFADKLKGFKLK